MRMNRKAHGKASQKAQKQQPENMGEELDRILDQNSFVFFRLSEL